MRRPAQRELLTRKGFPGRRERGQIPRENPLPQPHITKDLRETMGLDSWRRSFISDSSCCLPGFSCGAHLKRAIGPIERAPLQRSFSSSTSTAPDVVPSLPWETESHRRTESSLARDELRCRSTVARLAARARQQTALRHNFDACGSRSCYRETRTALVNPASH